MQYARPMASSSAPSAVFCGVPQGSVLFVFYTADLLSLTQSHGLTRHAYADDTQIVGICQPSETDVLQLQLSVSLDDVSAWMVANRLQLNPERRENGSTLVFVCASPVSVRVGSSSVQPVFTARNLRVHLDTGVRAYIHVTAVVPECFVNLRQIRSIRHCLPRAAL